MKRALLKTRLMYRMWIRYINSPASTKKPMTTEFILLVAIASAIVIKFKPMIEENIFPPKQDIVRYYDYVEPPGSNSLFD